MLPKQDNYNVGIYLRLSKDDERQGESLSIENQRRVLTNYVKEQGWSIYDEYVDDGISGVSFERPGVQRMLDDDIIDELSGLDISKMTPIDALNELYKLQNTVLRHQFFGGGLLIVVFPSLCRLLF